MRHKLQEERASITHKFKVGDHEGYITVGLYPDGEPGELFITMAKEGSTVSGLMDSFALAVSIALQHGVPLKLFCEKFAHTRFEPSGWSGNPELGYAKSIMDYIFRWLQMRFLTGQQQLLFESFRPKLSALSSQPSEIGDLNGLESEAREQKPEARPRLHSRRRRALQHRRHGRRAQLQLLRQHHDEERELLSLHELREHERVQLGAWWGAPFEKARRGGQLRLFSFVSSWLNCAVPFDCAQGRPYGTRFHSWAGNAALEAPLFHVTA